MITHIGHLVSKNLIMVRLRGDLFRCNVRLVPNEIITAGGSFTCVLELGQIFHYVNNYSHCESPWQSNSLMYHQYDRQE